MTGGWCTASGHLIWQYKEGYPQTGEKPHLEVLLLCGVNVVHQRRQEALQVAAPDVAAMGVLVQRAPQRRAVLADEQVEDCEDVSSTAHVLNLWMRHKGRTQQAQGDDGQCCGSAGPTDGIQKGEMEGQ